MVSACSSLQTEIGREVIVTHDHWTKVCSAKGKWLALPRPLLQHTVPSGRSMYTQFWKKNLAFHTLPAFSCASAQTQLSSPSLSQEQRKGIRCWAVCPYAESQHWGGRGQFGLPSEHPGLPLLGCSVGKNACYASVEISVWDPKDPLK